MLRPYRELLATPGGPRFSAAGFVARMPMSMVGLGVVLLVVAEHGRYGLAGALSATLAGVNAAAAPVIARQVDRRGQRRVLVPAAAMHAAGLGLFVVLVSSDAPVWSLFVAAVLAGASGPSIGSMVRARWGHVLGAGARLHTAYSFESVLDELIFVVGPLLVTVLATAIAPQVGLVTAIALLAVGSAALVTHRVSEPPPSLRPTSGARPSALGSPGMPALLATMLFIGGVFGAVEISSVAFADEHGHPALAGPLLASYAAGSMVAGLVFGAVRWRIPGRQRLLLGATAMTATAAPLAGIDTLAVLAGWLFVAGLGIAPTLISGFSLVEVTVPAGTVTEGLTWATTALVVGLSGTTWLSGRLVDSAGSGRAFTVAVVSGAGALVVCAASLRRLPV